MFKKVITIAILLCLIVSINVMTVIAEGETQQGGERGGMPPMGDMPSGDFAPPEGFMPPEGFTPPDGEFTPPQREERDDMEVTEPNADADITEKSKQTQENGEASNQTQGGNQQFGGQMPGFPGNMQNFNGQTQEEQQKGFFGFVKTYSTPITSVVLLGLAFIFVIFYRRKNY